MHWMTDDPVDQAMAARLIEARILKGYRHATDACKAHGFVYSTYMNHEGAQRGFARHVPRYARAFDVNANWLLTGRGVPRLKGRSQAELDLTPEERAVIELLRAQKQGVNS